MEGVTSCCIRRSSRRKFLMAAFAATCAITIVTLLLRRDLRLPMQLLPMAYWQSDAANLSVSALQGDSVAFSSKCTTTAAGVPMILHFIYKDANILQAYRAGLEACIKLNANWSVMLWTDDAINLLLSREYPSLQSVFRGYPHKLQRADAARYLVLYKFGGVYLDLDMRCHQPLLTSLSHIPCFLDRERSHQTRYLHGKNALAMNSAMGCKPGHPFFKKVVDFVFHPDRLKGRFVQPTTIFVTTGPIMLNTLFEQWTTSASRPPVTLLSESYFSPKINPRSPVYPMCRRMAQSKITNPRTAKQVVCLELEKLGFEKSDATFITNLTVAIHEFTHLGYYNQRSGGRFHAISQFPRILVYPRVPSFCQGPGHASPVTPTDITRASAAGASTEASNVTSTGVQPVHHVVVLQLKQATWHQQVASAGASTEASKVASAGASTEASKVTSAGASTEASKVTSAGASTEASKVTSAGASTEASKVTSAGASTLASTVG